MLNKSVSLLGIAALVAIFLCGVNFNEIRLGPSFLLMGVFLLILTFPVFFGKNPVSISITSIGVIVSAAYFLWRCQQSDVEALKVVDRRLVMLSLGSVLSLSWLLIKNQKFTARALLIFFSVVIVVNFSISLYQKLSDNSYQFWDVSMPTDEKSSGFLTHQNYFASIMAALSGYVLAAALLMRGAKVKIFSSVLLIMCIGSIVMSQSRGGTLAIVGVLLVAVAGAILLQRFRKKSDTWKFAIIAMSMIVVISAVSTFYINYLHEERSQNFTEAGARISMIDMGVKIFFERPIFGHGPESFSYLSTANWLFQEYGRMRAMPGHVHNEFVQMLVDFGAVGFLCISLVLVMAVIYGLISLFGRSDDNPNLDVLIVGAIAGMVGFLIQSFFSFLAHIPTTLLMMCFHLGILCSLGKVLQKRAGEKIWRCAMGFVFLGSSLWFLIEGYSLTKALLLFHKNTSHQAELIENIYDVGDLTKNQKYYIRGAAEAFVAHDGASEEGENDWLNLADEGYERALGIHPYAPEIFSGKARVLDLKREYKEAQLWHEKAMSRAGDLSHPLGYSQAYGRSLLSEVLYGQVSDLEVAERKMREAFQYLRYRRVKESNEAKVQRQKEVQFMSSWLSYAEGRRLYQEGDRLWKKRNAPRGMALMVAAQRKYKRSQKLIASYEPNWEPEWHQLVKNIRLLKAAKIAPEKISKEEIRGIALGPFKDGLDR